MNLPESEGGQAKSKASFFHPCSFGLLPEDVTSIESGFSLIKLSDQESLEGPAACLLVDSRSSQFAKRD